MSFYLEISTELESIRFSNISNLQRFIAMLGSGRKPT